MVKHTQKDPNQVITSEHCDDLRAKRVIIVGGEVPELKLPENISLNIPAPEIKVVEIPTQVIVKETEIKEIKIPVVHVERITEIQKIEVPVIIKEQEIKYIEVPIIQKEIEIVEKPVIITEYKEKDLSKFLKVLLVVQSLGIILLLIKSILK